MASVMLDAGHYGKYNRSPAINTYWESLMTWQLHLYLKTQLEKYGIKVGTTRSVQANDLALMRRGYASKGYDLFISLHSNAVGSSINESIDYPVAYVCISGKADTIATKLVKCVQRVMGTRQAGYISKRKLDGGGDYYGVLRGATAVGTPSLILQHSFHTQTKATRWLLNSDNLKTMAKEQAKVIAEYFGIKSQQSSQSTEEIKWYRIRKTWADEKSQVGAYKSLDGAKIACPQGYSVFDSTGKIVYTRGAGGGSVVTSGLQAADLKSLSEQEVIQKIGALFTQDQEKTKILACVSMAQFILESGYGKTELAQNANNCFGMKANLSGNTWSGSTWDGKSIYTKQTNQQDSNGKVYTITADFRKYPNIENSIADHSAYLLGAMKGDKKRYAGLEGCLNYKTAIQIIKDGGYATDINYVTKICNIIERWNLTKFNSTKQQQQKEEKTEQFQVRVLVNNLNIRSGPGTNFAKTGKYTGKGIFTIVDTASGVGAALWGKLKSGAGWIALEKSWLEYL